jgi:hypothetical protein
MAVTFCKTASGIRNRQIHKPQEVKSDKFAKYYSFVSNINQGESGAIVSWREQKPCLMPKA